MDAGSYGTIQTIADSPVNKIANPIVAARIPKILPITLAFLRPKRRMAVNTYAVALAKTAAITKFRKRDAVFIGSKDLFMATAPSKYRLYAFATASAS